MERAIRHIEMLLKKSANTIVLTGAGVSTYSGIPDYRGPSGVYTRNPDFKPITFQQFVNNLEYRQRYWARSFMGWPRISMAEKSVVHKSLESLESRGLVSALITQNVDGLHKSKRLLELHGNLHYVDCIACGDQTLRSDLQVKMKFLNPDWAISAGLPVDVASSNPDGDTEVANFHDFKYPGCEKCGGMIKPSVVFFGENMKPHVRNAAHEYVRNASALLVIGTSLKVFSAFRLVKLADDAGIPIVILNTGETRADSLPRVIKLDHEADVLSQMCA